MKALQIATVLKTNVQLAALNVEQILEDAENSGSSSSFVGLENKVTEFGSGGYRLTFMVMTFVFIIGFIIAAMKLFMANTQTRQDSKADIVWKVVAAVFGFGAVAFILLLSGVGGSLFR